MAQTSSLHTIAWRKVAVALRNEHNRYQKQHPYFIFQAICNHAAKRAGIDKASVFFHPLSRLAARVHKGTLYELEIVFPHQDPGVAHRFLDSLGAHLSNPENNFSLHGHGPVQDRNVETVAAEFGPLPDDEICLDFYTPFTFTPKDKKRPWLIDPAHFVRLLTDRLNRFFGLALKPGDFPAENLRLLPYYWHFRQHTHRAKSNGGRQDAAGMTGPLYLRHVPAALQPLLLACAELHAGRRVANGQGYYRLTAARPFFDEIIGRFDDFQAALGEIERGSDIATEIAETVLDKPGFIAELHSEMLQGAPTEKPANGFYVDKRRGGKRLIATLDPEAYLIHKYLHRILAPVMDRMFEECSVGFRPGCSRQEAASMIRRTFNEGFGHVLESDITAFFDEIDWDILAAKVHHHLPLADRLTRQLLARAARTPLEVQGKQVTRTKGLLQGSPLSPLLANLYLDSFDEEMERCGFRLVRYADDFVILARSREEAESALAAVRESLDGLKLTIKEEKSRIASIDLGFSFLGLSFGPGMDEEYVADSTLAKTLFITDRFVFAGIDYDSVVIRKKGQLLARFPLRQVAEIVILGSNSLSSKLLQRCSKANIPVSFCSPTGYYFNTLCPDSKKHFELNGHHFQRHAALAEPEMVALAAGIVTAKIHNYLVWFQESWPAEPSRNQIRQSLEALIASVAKAESIDIIRGYEGAAAREIFRFVNNRLTDPFFTSKGRKKRAREDAWNSLLDFSYSLLFTRINVLLRSRGLNPYLGVLHSHKDNYESLVCDLQEMFRCRMDRFAARVVNLGVIKEEHFRVDEYGRRSLEGPAIGTFLEHFEREMATRLGRDGGTLKQLLIAQVHAVHQWVLTGDGPRLYQADTQ